MNRKASPVLIGVILGIVLLFVTPAVYVGLYWWRLPTVKTKIPYYSNGLKYAARRPFKSDFENHVFVPALWIHRRLHPDSVESRAGYFVWKYGP
jgi:hypothetical protein